MFLYGPPVYEPTEADIETLRRAMQDCDPAAPDWLQLQVWLIEHSAEAGIDWQNLAVPAIMAMIRRAATPVNPTGWDAATFERNKWIYEQWKAGTAWGSILRNMSKYTSGEDIASIPGLKRAGRAYAKKMGLPEPPKRKSGRGKKTTTKKRSH